MKKTLRTKSFIFVCLIMASFVAFFVWTQASAFQSLSRLEQVMIVAIYLAVFLGTLIWH